MSTISRCLFRLSRANDKNTVCCYMYMGIINDFSPIFLRNMARYFITSYYYLLIKDHENKQTRPLGSATCKLHVELHTRPFVHRFDRTTFKTQTSLPPFALYLQSSSLFQTCKILIVMKPISTVGFVSNSQREQSLQVTGIGTGTYVGGLESDS